MSGALPLIVTLQLDEPTLATLDALRQTHFPPERNFLAAHITLFHALPGEQLAAITATLQEISAALEPMPLLFPQPRFLGRGVAITVESLPLVALRQQLAQGWLAWLTPQDRQRYQPHVTIQNKVTAELARALHTQLSATWVPLSGLGEGLQLWRYQGGPWEAVATFAFQRLPAA